VNLEGRSVHFIGIGGAGMSAIAKVLLERGCSVSGSDLKMSRAATMLEAMGAAVHVGHDASHISDDMVVVYSSAIPADNPELRRSEELGLTIMTRGEALASVLQDRRSIVVAGTHGKTTTTSMIVSILRHAGIDPTYLVGGGLNDVGTNARFGRDDIAVAESDESDGSFLLLEPTIAVVTNIEEDHLEYWNSFAAIREGFETFLNRVDKQGSVILPQHERALAGPLEGMHVMTFGDDGDVHADEVGLAPQGARFILVTPEGSSPVRLRVPGLHNVSNALAAATAALVVGVPLESVASGLGEFKGVERRFQIRGREGGITVIDDYAHHPTEVRATLAAARPGPWDRLVAVFQPHRYSRTEKLHRDFGRSFEHADRVIVMDVYGAGEAPVPGVSGKLVADAICSALPGRPVAYLPHRKDLMAYLQIYTRAGDALITLGAGDVSTVGEELLARLHADHST
jgi:UDP-N-acetylmuramate--alanine ligase